MKVESEEIWQSLNSASIITSKPCRRPLGPFLYPIGATSNKCYHLGLAEVLQYDVPSNYSSFTRSLLMHK